MREPKFRYWLQYLDNHIEAHFFTVEAIENHRGLNRKALFGAGIKILARDRCTGLKDKNNKEIYEGDKLEYDNTKYPSSAGVYLIEWSDEECGFICERQEPYNYLLPRIWHECEIIGDLFENPELVEQTK